MVYLYLCKACEQDRHGNCEGSQPSPNGTYGGRKCRCQCTGDPLWGKDNVISEDLKNELRRKMTELDRELKLCEYDH